jgi:hypothetical protein
VHTLVLLIALPAKQKPKQLSLVSTLFYNKYIYIYIYIYIYVCDFHSTHLLMHSSSLICTTRNLQTRRSLSVQSLLSTFTQ